MPSSRFALATLLPAAAITLTGCSGPASSSDASQTVPAGVVEQYTTLAAEVAERGGAVTSGDWTVNYIVEAAEPWFEAHAGHGQLFREPAAGENHHIEIIPTEAAT